MAKINFEHEINCSPSEFWRLNFDKEFTQKLYFEGLHMKEFAISEFSETEQEIRRTFRALPNLDMPGPVAKVLGNSFRYSEAGTYNKKAGIYSWKTTPSSMAEKTKNEGTMRLVDLGNNKVRRVVDITLEVNVMLIGKTIEGVFEKALRDGWNHSAKYFNEYLAKQG